MTRELLNDYGAMLRPRGRETIWYVVWLYSQPDRCIEVPIKRTDRWCTSCCLARRGHVGDQEFNSDVIDFITWVRKSLPTSRRAKTQALQRCRWESGCQCDFGQELVAALSHQDFLLFSQSWFHKYHWCNSWRALNRSWAQWCWLDITYPAGSPFK